MTNGMTLRERGGRGYTNTPLFPSPFLCVVGWEQHTNAITLDKLLSQEFFYRDCTWHNCAATRKRTSSQHFMKRLSYPGDPKSYVSKRNASRCSRGLQGVSFSGSCLYPYLVPLINVCSVCIEHDTAQTSDRSPKLPTLVGNR